MHKEAGAPGGANLSRRLKGITRFEKTSSDLGEGRKTRPDVARDGKKGCFPPPEREKLREGKSSTGEGCSPRKKGAASRKPKSPTGQPLEAT